jgi:hypothetical protein
MSMGQKTWAEHQSILEGCTFGCIYLTRFCIQLIYNGLYGDMNPSLPKRPNRLKPVSERTGFIVKHLLNLVHVLPATDCWEFTGPKDAYVYLNRVFRPLLYRQRVHLLRILSGIASDMEVLQRIAADRQIKVVRPRSRCPLLGSACVACHPFEDKRRYRRGRACL